MNRSNAATGVAARSMLATEHQRDERGRSGGIQALFAGVLAVLLAIGWAANHFAALIPAIGDREHLGETERAR